MKKLLFMTIGIGLLVFNGAYCADLHVVGLQYIVVLGSASVGTIFARKAAKL